MKGINGLTKVIKSALQKKVDEEARAKRGIIKDGQFQSGAMSYPAVSAVDVDTSAGRSVWAQLDRNGRAVIVGA